MRQGIGAVGVRVVRGVARALARAERRLVLLECELVSRDLERRARAFRAASDAAALLGARSGGGSAL